MLNATLNNEFLINHMIVTGATKPKGNLKHATGGKREKKQGQRSDRGLQSDDEV